VTKREVDRITRETLAADCGCAPELFGSEGVAIIHTRPRVWLLASMDRDGSAADWSLIEAVEAQVSVFHQSPILRIERNSIHLSKIVLPEKTTRALERSTAA
jgi:hypothetical protein